MLKKRGADDKLYRLCRALEDEMWERKGMPANLDYYAAPVLYTPGIGPSLRANLRRQQGLRLDGPL
jgi:citrate synthase